MDYRSIYESLKSVLTTEALLTDPKQTATALLSIKYDIIEPRDSNQLSYSLMSLCYLLSVHHSAWSVVEQPLVDKIIEIAGSSEEPTNVICPALSILSLVALETREPKHISENVLPNLLRSFAKQPATMTEIISRLSSSNLQEVTVTIQFVASILLGLVIPEAGQSIMYSTMRQAGLWGNLSQLVQNRNTASSVRTYLADLQVLLKVAMWKKSNLQGDPVNNPLHREVFDEAQQLVTNYVGVLKDGETDWEKAGITGESALDYFNHNGGWGSLLDFVDFMSYDNHTLRKQYLEHSAFTEENVRFPLARASIAVSNILLDIFGIEGEHANDDREEEILSGASEIYQPPEYISGTKGAFPFILKGEKKGLFLNSGPNANANVGSGASIENFMKSLDNLRPLFFDWNALHFTGVSNFMRIWVAANAKQYDFNNIEQLMKILFLQATLGAIDSSSFTAVDNVIAKLNGTAYDELRAHQLKAVETDIKSVWGDDVANLHREFTTEAQAFVMEQRSRLLLSGDWFFVDDPTTAGVSRHKVTSNPGLADGNNTEGGWYFICMSASRKTLQYNVFSQRLEEIPGTDMLTRSIDLSTVSKVHISQVTPPMISPKGAKRVSLKHRIIYSKIQIICTGNSRENSSFIFYTETPEKAAAWGDGLLMLRNKSYQSDETRKYIELYADTKLRLQLMDFGATDTEYGKNVAEPDLGDFDNGLVSTDFYYEYN